MPSVAPRFQARVGLVPREPPARIPENHRHSGVGFGGCAVSVGSARREGGAAGGSGGTAGRATSARTSEVSCVVSVASTVGSMAMLMASATMATSSVALVRWRLALAKSFDESVRAHVSTGRDRTDTSMGCG
jgi:hypothetical protein